MTVTFSDFELTQRIRWYIAVRWFYIAAIAGPGLVTLIVQYGMNYQAAQDSAIVLGAISVNALMLWAMHWRLRRQRFHEALAVSQIIFDIVLMTGAFMLNGGVETPFVMLYCIPILMSGAILGRRAVYVTGLSTTVLFVGLALLDFADVLKPANIAAPILHDNADNFLPTLIVAAATLLTITVIADFVGRLVRQRTQLAQELEAVNTEKAKIEAIIKTMGSSLVATDPGGRITLVNDNFLYLTGWQLDEVIGHPLDEILPMIDENGHLVPADERPSPEVSAMGISTGSLRTVSHYSYVRKDGSSFPFVSYLAPIVLNRQVIGLTNVFDDVTNVQKLEQLKTNFVALVSHQLKTPIGEIKGYVDNMLYGVSGKLNHQQTEYLGHVRDMAERASKLVTDMLDITILERGGLTLDTRPVRLAPVIKQVQQVYTDRLHQKQLTIKVVRPPHEITVLADSDKLLETFGNIVANAIAYSSRGTITISSKITEGFAEVSISDQGSGMDKATLSVLFDKGMMLSAAPTAEGGTGLGLYLAKQLMGLQGGDIKVVSTSKKGTTICITIPLMKG